MTELVPAQQKVANLRQLLEKSKSQIAIALPKHMTAERMLRVAMTCAQRNPRLLDCTPVSFVGAIVQSSQLGLEPDTLGARAYLIPRKNNRRGGVLEVNFQPGYQGLMDLARRSKEIASFEAREVYAGDKFIFTFGLKPTLVHVPGGETDEEKITHVYAIAQLINGRAQFEVMTADQIEAHRERYAKDGREDSAWQTSWASMAKKTVIIRLCKFLPASVELQTAVALAERDEVGLPQDLDAIIDLPAAPPAHGEGPAPATKLDTLIDTLATKPAEAVASFSRTEPPATELAPAAAAGEPAGLFDGGAPNEVTRKGLITAIADELAKWETPTMTEERRTLLFATLSNGDGDLTKLDPAMLSDMLETFRAYTAKKPAVVKVVRAALGLK